MDPMPVLPSNIYSDCSVPDFKYCEGHPYVTEKRKAKE